MTDYVGKWVVVRRYPNAQNSFIGKIQCLFVRKQTEKQIYGTEHEKPNWKGYLYHYNKAEIVRLIDKDNVRNLLSAQRNVRNLYKERDQELKEFFRGILKSLAEGEL